jgi:hypothetical protein
VRPAVELLEGRCVPAVFFASPAAADGAAGSLRAAVLQANGDSQDDTILLGAGVYNLTLANASGLQENSAATGDLDVTGANHTVTIQGAGAGATVIDAHQIDRVFQVLPGASLVLRALSVRGGLAQDDGTAGAYAGSTNAFGGGILNQGTMVLDHVLVEGNEALAGNVASRFSQGFVAAGGGVFSSGTLTMIDSTARGNLALGGNGIPGGQPMGSAGGNAVGGGVAVAFMGATGTITACTISGNTALGGQGGAGVAATGDLDGGPGGDAFGGGLFVGEGTGVELSDSTVAGNTALGGLGGLGAFDTNTGTAGAGGDGGAGRGGGIALDGTPNRPGQAALFNSTIAANSALGGQGGPPGRGTATGNPGAGEGGGLFAGNNPNVTVTTSSCLFAGNAAAAAPDFDGTFGSAAATLVQDGAGAGGINNGVNGNLVGVDPRLGPLADNGGPTQTMALLPGSPAIDHGRNDLGLATDQRGFARVANGAADIGAFEVQRQPAPPPPAPPPDNPQAVVLRHRGQSFVEVLSSRTGRVRSVLGPYRGHVTVRLLDLDGDGTLDLLLLLPHKHKLAFDGATLAPLPAG